MFHSHHPDAAAAIGGLIGPPVAGEVIDQVSYAAAIVLAMALTAAAAGVLFSLSPRHASSMAPLAGAEPEIVSSV